MFHQGLFIFDDFLLKLEHTRYLEMYTLYSLSKKISELKYHPYTNWHDTIKF